MNAVETDISLCFLSTILAKSVWGWIFMFWNPWGHKIFTIFEIRFGHQVASLSREKYIHIHFTFWAAIFDSKYVLSNVAWLQFSKQLTVIWLLKENVGTQPPLLGYQSHWYLYLKGGARHIQCLLGVCVLLLSQVSHYAVLWFPWSMMGGWGWGAVPLCHSSCLWWLFFQSTMSNHHVEKSLASTSLWSSGVSAHVRFAPVPRCQSVFLSVDVTSGMVHT